MNSHPTCQELSEQGLSHADTPGHRFKEVTFLSRGIQSHVEKIADEPNHPPTGRLDL
ncbi:hypothetical protein [Planctomicrobium sp. SH527]|uniref:hypothetical protein n=1 Tax=Planctomicrobium sp. SH527 TaxID=3448123 RepID=UPI003F5B6FC4